MPSLRCRVVRWVSDDPQPGWVETQFHGADGQVWQMFDKPSIFERPGGPALTPSSPYPIEIQLPVTVLSTSDTESGRVAVVTLPFGLGYDLAQDTFGVFAADLRDDA